MRGGMRGSHSLWRDLLAHLVDGTTAEAGWVAWAEGSGTVVFPSAFRSPRGASALADFPDPPTEPRLVNWMEADPWAVWCAARQTHSCAIAPILLAGSTVGTLGLSSRSRGAIGAEALGHLTLGAWLAAQVHSWEGRSERLKARLDAVNRRRLGESGRHVRRAESAERRRLSRELHDGVGQALSALLIRIRWTMSRESAGLDDLRVFEATAQDALDATRALAYGLRLAANGGDPIEEAQHYAETILRAANCGLSWVDVRPDRRLQREVAPEIARVIKESITNVVRHAQADAVQVRLESLDGRIRVTVHDNGVGFSLGQAASNTGRRGLGLRSSAERLAQIGGRFEIRSSPSEGTLVTVEAPRP